MTPEDFIKKWRDVELSELAASHDHFNELCELLEIKKPTDDDPTGQRFAFEKPVPKAGKSGGGGFADVWRKGCFVWEYKRKGKLTTLAAALAQARDYADLLEHPPLAIACDIDEIQIRTMFTGCVSVTHTIRLLDLNDVGKRQLLRRCFIDPASLRPDLTPQSVTEEAARKFATLAQNLRERRDNHNRLHDSKRVAHFLNKIVFCLFAEDSGLLPNNVFSAIVEEALRDKSGLSGMLADLFDKMQTGKGYFGTVRIPWFNGGLFDDDDVLELLYSEVQTLSDATRLDWASIEPVIFGTLFERGLDPARRKEMAGLFDAMQPRPALGRRRKASTTPMSTLPLRGGATAAQRSLGKGVGIHYTDTATIMKIVEPVVLRPLIVEWEDVKVAIAKAKRVARKDSLYLSFRERLGAFRVLDPACGSGAFLYIALRRLKDFDRRVEEEGKALGATADPKGQRITPKTVLGIEVNSYAAELARVTVWIGELQWQMANGYGVTRRPILGALDGIENRDALLDKNNKIAAWPIADAIVGNPPFLGAKRLIRGLGEQYVEVLRSAYKGQVSRFADLVCFWFEKARMQIENDKLSYCGFVATNSIRGGRNRQSLDRIAGTCSIFEAWSDEPWVVNGAAVRVSLVSFCKKGADMHTVRALDGKVVDEINPDLTPRLDGVGVDLTLATKLAENSDVAFIGSQKSGAFNISGDVARRMLLEPMNPNGRANSEVLRPWVNGRAITGRNPDDWIVDFGVEGDEAKCALYEAPFQHLVEHVRDARLANTGISAADLADKWWLHWRPRPEMRNAMRSLRRQIVSPRVAKHRLFAWLHSSVLVDSAAVAIARDDDTTFGILHSLTHELWTLRLCTWLGVGNDPRYTPSTTFETFPFPEGLSPNVVAAEYLSDPRAKRIAKMASKLNELRESWLNPSDLVKREPEVVSGYPERIVPKTQAAASQLKKRTLTNLYNERPTWLVHAHRELDQAVAAAYGWPESLADRAQPENPNAIDRDVAVEEILKRLFDLNQERAKVGR